VTLDFDSDKAGLPPIILFDQPRRRPSIDDSRQVQNGPGNMDQNESDNGQNELSQLPCFTNELQNKRLDQKLYSIFI